jgi:hypothetical protein
MLKEAMLNTIILSNLQVKILPNPQSKTLKRSEFLPISSKIFHSIITLSDPNPKQLRNYPNSASAHNTRSNETLKKTPKKKQT